MKSPNSYIIPSSLLKRIHRNACSLITLSHHLQISFLLKTELHLAHSDFDNLPSYKSSIPGKFIALQINLKPVTGSSTTTLYARDTLWVTVLPAEAYIEYKKKSCKSRVLYSCVCWYQHRQNFGFLENASQKASVYGLLSQGYKRV